MKKGSTLFWTLNSNVLAIDCTYNMGNFHVTRKSRAILFSSSAYEGGWKYSLAIASNIVSQASLIMRLRVDLRK